MDRLVSRIINEVPKAKDFALALQDLLDQGAPRPVVISMARSAINDERTRLAAERSSL
jgi:hypothetical protein